MGETGATALGHPRVHLRRTDSTNQRARSLAVSGAPNGTLVSAGEQTAGRGRQGRAWVAPAGSALLCSLILRDPPALLSLIAGVAVCDAIGAHPMSGRTQRAHPPSHPEGHKRGAGGGRVGVKWPNDVVVEPGLAKLAGILVEGRPQEGWAVLGIGLNVAVRVEQLPDDVRERATSLELPSGAIEVLLGRLMEALDRRLKEPVESVLDEWRERDALVGREVSWDQGRGVAGGIDDTGRLIVTLADGSTTKLDGGEVHLGRAL